MWVRMHHLPSAAYRLGSGCHPSRVLCVVLMTVPDACETPCRHADLPATGWEGGAAAEAINHPETIGPDLHKAGSPLLPPLKGFVNAIGYTPDGTPMDKAGNLSVK